jgi:outer membrane protein assembly factor BamB
MFELSLACALVPLSLRSASEDWPQFLGPERSGDAGAVELSFDWPESGPAVAWRAGIGPGFGGVAVQGGEVFLFDRVDHERDVLRVFSLETGAELWSAGYAVPGRLQFPGSRTVPAVVETRVVTCGGFGHVAVFDRETKALDWIVDLEEAYAGEQPMFGWSAAPLVHEGLVIVPALAKEAGLVAFELETGAELWKSEAVGHSHSTPTLVELLGKKQVLFLSTIEQATGEDASSPMAITSFDPANGKTLWRHTLTLTRLPIPGPLAVDGERIFLTGGYDGGSTLLRISRDGTEYAFEELFHIARGAQVHRPLLYGGHLYLLANENKNHEGSRRKDGGLLCLALDGKELWRTGDEPFFGRGSAILAGEHLLIQDGFDGTLRVVRASPEGYAQVAEAQVFSQSRDRDRQMWAPMALAGNRLLMRSQEELVCVQL